MKAMGQAKGSSFKKARRVRRLRLLSDGIILRAVFYCLLCVSGYVVYADYQMLMARDETVDTRFTTREPVPLVRPGKDDHVRPYLPFTRPEEESNRKRANLPVNLPKKVESGPMRFERGPRGRAVAAGRIVPGSASELEKFLKGQEGEVKKIVLHSPGGNVADALKMAKLIRKNKLDTEVPDDAYCASSCPLVFAGGKKRFAGTKAWIGVHQVYAGKNARGTLDHGMSEAQKISARCQAALVQFGIDPRLWIHAMQTPKDRLYFLTGEQLREYKLATAVQKSK